jgi:Mrp family chromosome partitioning ATPase
VARTDQELADRYAFYQAYGGVCGYCPNSIDFCEFEIEHILPQHLAKDPAKWAQTLSDYALPPDFMMDGDENRLPACRPCNGQKHGNLMTVGQVAIFVAKARGKAPLVQQLREQKISQRKASRLLANLAKAVSSQAITPADLVAALGDDPVSPTAEPLSRVSRPIDALARERVIRAFGSASDALLSWPQETDGCWLERPELSLISERAVDPEINIIAVLGEPGSGKSALLARLGCTLRDSGRSLLAIKADLVPRDVATIRDLDEWLGLPESIVDILDRLASKTPVTVLVDQLDSLALLMDSRTGRLSALLALILQVSQIPKVTVVVSIRSFDAEHDQRLKDLLQRRGTCKIELAEPPWPEVEKLLVSRGFQTASWSEEVKQILRIPQHLKCFVAQFRTNTGPPTFMNYQAMLEQIFRERVLLPYGRNAVQTLYAVADALAEEEELWLPVARFDDRFDTELHQLQEANILIRSSDGSRLSFTHQTVFDYVRARSFTARGAKLADFVIHRQDSLAVRPPLWSTLNYIRNADPRSYEREVSAILNHSETRLHVKLLIIAFLGTVSEPVDHEVAWLIPLLADDSTRPHVVQAIQGSKIWRFLLRGGLEAPARLNSNAAWQVSWVWRAEVQNDKDFVLDFIERNWIEFKEFDNATLNSLGELKKWDERAFRQLLIVLGRTDVGAFWICDLARKIVQDARETAIRLVRIKLDLDLTRARANCTPDPPPPPSDAPLEGNIEAVVNTGKGLQPLKSLLDHRSTGWYGLNNVAKAAPAEFIEAVWSWIESIALDLARNHHHLTLSYITDYDWRFGEQFPGYLATTIWDSIVLFAEADTERFLRWTSISECSSSLSIHLLIVRGLTKIAAHHPAPAVKYLLGDSRRLAVNSNLGGRNATRDLIGALGPVVSDSDLDVLVAAIQDWQKWPSEVGEESHDERTRWNYEAQNTLLSYQPYPLSG